MAIKMNSSLTKNKQKKILANLSEMLTVLVLGTQKTMS